MLRGDMGTAATMMAMALSAGVLCACGAGGSAATGTPAPTQPAAPAITTAAALNGAVIVSLSSATSGATIYYTVDGSTPTASSQIYEAPFLVSSSLTVNAIAQGTGGASKVASQNFSLSIPSGTLVWSDEFANTSGSNAQPNPQVWTYDTGNSGFGNDELETYCAWGSNTAPCSTAGPSAYVGTDGYLHVVAQQPSPGVYTSARLKTEGLFSFQYGRIEFRAQVPEAQGYWPAAWLMGSNIATADWPACGEMDVLERIDAAGPPPAGTQSNPVTGTSDWNQGSIHGTGFTGANLGATYDFTGGATASGWHTYGMIWNKGSVSYYVDNPGQPYVTYTPANLAGLSGALWPFDSGQSNFIILNLAVGGSWPGAPNASTPFPSQMLVDYVRIYTN
jgi:beta-glucanase (GH16 family)